MGYSSASITASVLRSHATDLFSSIQANRQDGLHTESPVSSRNFLPSMVSRGNKLPQEQNRLGIGKLFFRLLNDCSACLVILIGKLLPVLYNV